MALQTDASTWEERLARVERDRLGRFTPVVGKRARMTGAALDFSVSQMAELGVREPGWVHDHGFDVQTLGIAYHLVAFAALEPQVFDRRF
jgi:hypothetical protein